MKKILVLLMLSGAVWASAYIADLKTWTDGEVLYDTDLNGNFSKVDDALDDIIAALNDSINNRMRSTILVPLAEAAGDSFYAGDSLTVEISRNSPLGNAGALYVKSATSVIEKVRLFWDFELPNSLAKVDSIRTTVWTERTNGADFAALYVLDDSTRYAYKAAIDSTGSMYSATARTLKVYSQPVSTNSIVGGRLRIEAILQMTNSDSMYVGPIELIVTNR